MTSAGSPPSRGRVVMVVDNDVVRDSRVQKQARSAADRGWDVVLLGMSRDRKRHEFALGGATVRLVPVPGPLDQPRHVFRRAPLRAPLAHPTQAVRARRDQEARVRDLDVRNRAGRLLADAEAGRRGAAGLRAGAAGVALARAVSTVRDGWTAARSRQTDDLRETRAVLDRPIDRLATAAWARGRGDGVWRHFDPHLYDFELAFGPEIDRLRPDLVHANDFRMSGVGARAVARLRTRGTDARLVYDCHEWVPGMSPRTRNSRWLDAQSAYEREYVDAADAVTTVSGPLAEMLVEAHGLTQTPTVVLNAPVVDGSGDEAGPTVRDLCGLADDVPLLVYSGVLARQRGVAIMVETLPRLPDVHVALVVSSPTSAFARELLARAADLGVDDRIHLCPYVAPEQVVRYVSTATAGVHPTTHLPNHEISLATKFFEYAHARIPIVVSDVRTMSDAVRLHGIGEVFVAEDEDDYVRAIRTVVDAPASYRRAYEAPGLLDDWTWEKQADVLDEVYARLVEGR